MRKFYALLLTMIFLVSILPNTGNADITKLRVIWQRGEGSDFDHGGKNFSSCIFWPQNYTASPTDENYFRGVYDAEPSADRCGHMAMLKLNDAWYVFYLTVLTNGTYTNGWKNSSSGEARTFGNYHHWARRTNAIWCNIHGSIINESGDAWIAYATNDGSTNKIVYRYYWASNNTFSGERTVISGSASYFAPRVLRDFDSNRIFIYYEHHGTDGTYVVYTDNWGKNWSTPQLVNSDYGASTTGIGVCKWNGKYYMFLSDNGDRDAVILNSTDGINYVYQQTVYAHSTTYPYFYAHDLQPINDTYIVLLYTRRNSDGSRYNFIETRKMTSSGTFEFVHKVNIGKGGCNGHGDIAVLEGSLEEENDGDDDTDDILQFIDINGKPNASTIYTPNPIINWTYVPAKRYELQIANDSSFTDIFIDIDDINETNYPDYYTQNSTRVSFELPPSYALESGKTYYFRVRAFTWKSYST